MSHAVARLVGELEINRDTSSPPLFSYVVISFFICVSAHAIILLADARRISFFQTLSNASRWRGNLQVARTSRWRGNLQVARTSRWRGTSRWREPPGGEGTSRWREPPAGGVEPPGGENLQVARLNLPRWREPPLSLLRPGGAWQRRLEGAHERWTGLTHGQGGWGNRRWHPIGVQPLSPMLSRLTSQNERPVIGVQPLCNPLFCEVMRDLMRFDEV